MTSRGSTGGPQEDRGTTLKDDPLRRGLCHRLSGIQILRQYPLFSMLKFNYHKTRHQASALTDAGRASEPSRY